MECKMKEYYIRINSKGATLFVRNEEGHTMDLIEFVSDLNDINEILLAFIDWIGEERVYHDSAKHDEVWYTFVREMQSV